MLLKKDLKSIQTILTKLDTKREKLLKFTREAIRLTSQAIIYTHRFDSKKAQYYLKQAEQRIKKAESFAEGQQWFRVYNNLLTAYQELAEAKIFYHFVFSEKLLSLKEARVDAVPYLLGLLDFTGELRRVILTMLLRGDIQKADKMMKVMENVFDDLSMLDHTSILSSFRHKLDASRRVVEATRGDVVTEIRRWSLESEIKKFKEKIDTI